MMVSTKGRYALRIMIDLAEHEAEGFVSLKDVACRQGISMKYMEAIVAVLNKAGLLNSRRGKTGGYRLSRDPGEITAGEVLRLTEGSLAPVACMEGGGCGVCVRAAGCQTLPMWKALDALIEHYLEGVTIRDLVEGTVQKPEM